MQGSLPLPQWLCLHSVAAIRSYRSFTLRSAGFVGVHHLETHENKEPGANSVAIRGIRAGAKFRQADDLFVEEFERWRNLRISKNTVCARMRGCFSAANGSCSYRIRENPVAAHRSVALNANSSISWQTPVFRFRNPKNLHRARLWPVLQFQRAFARKPYVRVAGNKAGEELLLVEEEEVGSESEAYSTEEKKLIKGEKKRAEADLNHKGELESESESDRDSQDDEDEKKQAKEEKMTAKAKIKYSEELYKDIRKTIKTEEKRHKKEDKNKLKAAKKHKDDLDRNIEIDDAQEHSLDMKSKWQSNLKLDEESTSEWDDEEGDDGMTDSLSEEDEEEIQLLEDEISAREIENELFEELEDKLEDLDEEDAFWDEEEEGDVVAGDGGDGGGVVLGGTDWGQKALDLAQEVVVQAGSNLSLFAFKVSPDGVIRVRLDKLSDRYGSPTMSEIEHFSRSFSSVLEESGQAGTLPKDVDVEVSSPGAERVVTVPDDLERFKELPMYVKYLEGARETGSGQDGGLLEKDGVLELESLDVNAGLSVWKVANVKVNREVKGKGRPLNSKQKKWRAEVPLESLKQVRLYMDV